MSRFQWDKFGELARLRRRTWFLTLGGFGSGLWNRRRRDPAAGKEATGAAFA